MAGDWVPIQIDIVRRREVLGISDRTKRSRWEVVGLLVDFWGWVSAESRECHVPNVTISTLVAAIGADEPFWTAVEAVGWIRLTDDGLEIPNWERWLSRSAKTRLQNVMRKRDERERRSRCHVDVTQKSRSDRDQLATTDDRGEMTSSPPTPPGAGEGEQEPEKTPDPETERAWAVFREATAARRRKGRHPIEDIDAYVARLRREHAHPREVWPEIDDELARRDLQDRRRAALQILQGRLGLSWKGLRGNYQILEEGLLGPRPGLITAWNALAVGDLEKAIEGSNGPAAVAGSTLNPEDHRRLELAGAGPGEASGSPSAGRRERK